MRVARRPNGFFVRFDGYGDFDIQGSLIACAALPYVPEHTIRHLLLDQVLPALLGQRHSVVLHASAVALDGRAIAFLGRAGTGKSTLAAAMIERGAAVVTDDAVVIDTRRPRAVVPTYPGVRLWPDSRTLVRTRRRVSRSQVAHYSPKQRWAGDAVPFHADVLPLAAMYVIGRGNRGRFVSLSAREAMMALVCHSMTLDPTDREAMRRAFEIASATVARVVVTRLIVGPGRAGLRAATDAVLARELRLNPRITAG